MADFPGGVTESFYLTPTPSPQAAVPLWQGDKGMGARAGHPLGTKEGLDQNPSLR
jgi:hypothetical protein